MVQLRGVALSVPCNVSIVDNSLEKLEQLRQTGRPEWSLKEFEAATEALPGILNELVRQLKKAQNG